MNCRVLMSSGTLGFFVSAIGFSLGGQTSRINVPPNHRFTAAVAFGVSQHRKLPHRGLEVTRAVDDGPVLELWASPQRQASLERQALPEPASRAFRPQASRERA